MITKDYFVKAKYSFVQTNNEVLFWKSTITLRKNEILFCKNEIKKCHGYHFMGTVRVLSSYIMSEIYQKYTTIFRRKLFNLMLKEIVDAQTLNSKWSQLLKKYSNMKKYTSQLIEWTAFLSRL